jgi:uncharacterized MnhB-related membrane protein
MIAAVTIGMGVVMVVAAFLALYLENLVGAVIAAGVISLLASVLYLVLAAPDVAMTEAAIGSALTTLVFLYAISRLPGHKETDKKEEAG